MKKRKVYEDDDGRTIADMSGVSRPSAFLPRREKAPRQENREDSQKGGFLIEENTQPFTREERRMYIFAALRASMLIAGAFIVGLGAVILIMILAWS